MATWEHMAILGGSKTSRFFYRKLYNRDTRLVTVQEKTKKVALNVLHVSFSIYSLQILAILLSIFQ